MSIWSNTSVAMPAELVHTFCWDGFFTHGERDDASSSSWTGPVEHVTTEAAAWRLLADRFDPNVPGVRVTTEHLCNAAFYEPAIDVDIYTAMIRRLDRHFKTRWQIDATRWARWWNWVCIDANSIDYGHEPVWTAERDGLTDREQRFAKALLCEFFACEAESDLDEGSAP